MASYHFKLALAVVFVVLADTAYCEEDEIPGLGKWTHPKDFECYTCPPGSCNTVVEENKEPCTGNNDYCVTLVKNGEVTNRGCASKLKKLFKDGDTRYDCLSNKCNKVAKTELANYKKCISCDSAKNDKCVEGKELTATRDCNGKCMIALYSTEDGREGLVRGCLDDKEANDRDCSSKEKKCKECSDADCTEKVYPEDFFKCYNCNADTCKNTDDKLKSTYCNYYKKDDACAFQFNNENKFEKALCKSHYEKSKVAELEKAGKLVTCTEAGCNSPDKIPATPQCILCDSTSNPKCATEPETITEKVNCDFNYCFTAIKDQNTKRGCHSQLDEALKQTCTISSGFPCTQCKTTSCNDKIYPDTRKKCKMCNSADDKDCESDPKKEGYCIKYDENDACVTHYDQGTKVTKRGCNSEFPCDGKDDKKCRKCADNACNKIDLKKENGAMGIYLTVGAVLAMMCHLVL